MADKYRITNNVQINLRNGCWEWIRATDSDGYARLEATQDVKVFVHRYAYEAFVGKIIEGMTVDHICKNRKCCNPEHLRLMTIRDNILAGDTIAARNLAKTHCLRGHEFIENNTYKVKGERVCKTCRKIRQDKFNKIGAAPKKTILERITLKLKDDGNGCQVWVGVKDRNGYGHIKVNKKVISVHKIVYQEAIGYIPSGMGVYRKCGNKLCCAVEHLHLLSIGSTPSKGKIITIKLGG